MTTPTNTFDVSVMMQVEASDFGMLDVIKDFDSWLNPWNLLVRIIVNLNIHHYNNNIKS